MRATFDDSRAALRREMLQVGMGAGALLLRWITSHEATVVAAAALVFNSAALPYLAPSLTRPFRGHRHFDPGLVLFPASVLLLLFLIPERLDIVAATWGIMAAGDGMAAIVGRRISSAPIPWNRSRTVAGSAAFVIFGGAAGAFLSWWCSPRVMPPPFPWFTIWMPFAAALAAAAAETLPIRLDDNVSVPVAAAAVLWSASVVNEDLVAAALARAGGVLPAALAANAVVATAGYFAGTVTRTGALCGAIIGIVILETAGWSGWGLLLATFAIAVIASRLGLQRKAMLGIAEPRAGRRGVANAIANTGVAVVAAVLSATTYAADVALIGFVAALAAGGSDTVASEIGKAWGRRTVLVTTLGRVRAGTSGAMSLEGTAAGLTAAVALAGIAIVLGLAPRSALPAIVIGATAGSLIESVLGATLETQGVLDNDVLNLINTAVAALAAIWVFLTFK